MSEPEISNLARRLAEQNNVDWRRLNGSGPAGSVVERDVLDYLARVMAGEEAVDPTPEPLPDGMESWTEVGADSVGNYSRAASARPADQEFGAGNAAAGQDQAASDLADDLFLLDDEDDFEAPAAFDPAPARHAEPSGSSGFHMASTAADDDDLLLVSDDDLLTDEPAAGGADPIAAAAEPVVPEAQAPVSSSPFEPSPFEPDPFEPAPAKAVDTWVGEDLRLGGSAFEPAPDSAADLWVTSEEEAAAADVASMDLFEPDELVATPSEDAPGTATPDGAFDPGLGWSAAEGASVLDAGSAPVEVVAAPEPSVAHDFASAHTHAVEEDADEAGDALRLDDLEEAEFLTDLSAVDGADDNEAWLEAGSAPDAKPAEDEFATRAVTSPWEQPAAESPALYQAEAAERAAEPSPERAQEPGPVLAAAALEAAQPVAAAALPLMRAPNLLRRNLDVGALAAAQLAIGLELGNEEPLAVAPFLLRAVAKAAREVGVAGGQVALAELDGGLRLRRVDSAALRPFVDLARELEAAGGEEDEVALVAVDLSGLELDEAILELGAPAVTFGRILYDSEVGGYRSTLALTGDLPLDQGSRLLARVAELLSAPIRLLV